MKTLTIASALCLGILLAACGDEATKKKPADLSQINDAIKYRDDLSVHPGCATDYEANYPFAYTPASIPEYRCMAKQYPIPAGVQELRDKPVVLLIHGNSDSPRCWERDTGTMESEPPHRSMLADRLSEVGFKVYAVDARIDKVTDDPKHNAAKNIDHGWYVPIAQHFIKSVFKANSGRRFVLIGCSMGSTVIRDALRRLHIEHMQGDEFNPWKDLDRAILLCGGNHGVSTYTKLCGTNQTMSSSAACEFGDRGSFAPTPFLKALNGPNGVYETPCSDGNLAFGSPDTCGGNTVRYTTVVMRDIAQGSYQDEFVSEASSHLEGAENLTISLTDFDETEYIASFLKNHTGSCRSKAAIDIVLKKLAE
jgi:pimeloyl-ACP methyl ester carboxylesterase